MTNRRKILHLITTIDRGGAEKQLLVLIRNQISIGQEVSVFFLKGRSELRVNLIDVGATVHQPNYRSFFGNIFDLKLLLEQIKPEVVHAHLPRAEILARILKCYRKSKFVVTRHNSEPFFPRLGYPVSAFLSQWVLRKAHRLICISEATREFLIMHREVPVSIQEKTEIIRYGYDETFQFLERKGEFDYVIGTISRLTPQKNVQVQIEALGIICQKSKRPWRLKIVGSGSLESELRRKVQLLNLEEQVEFMGHVSDVRNAFSQFDIFVLSSLYEGFGLVLLEAMQNRVPIVASNTSAVPEVLGTEYPGFFNPRYAEKLADIILRLESTHERSAMIEGYEQRLALFEPRHMSERILEVYDSDFTI